MDLGVGNVGLIFCTDALRISFFSGFLWKESVSLNNYVFSHKWAHLLNVNTSKAIFIILTYGGYSDIFIYM